MGVHVHAQVPVQSEYEVRREMGIWWALNSREDGTLSDSWLVLECHS